MGESDNYSGAPTSITAGGNNSNNIMNSSETIISNNEHISKN